MKRLLFAGAVMLILLGLSSCVAGDDIGGDFFFRSIYPRVTNTYNNGSLALQWRNGYFQNLFVGGVAVVPGGAPHNLLSASHLDTTVNAALRGALITGQGGAPTWSRLAIGADSRFLRSDGTDASWSTLLLNNGEAVQWKDGGGVTRSILFLGGGGFHMLNPTGAGLNLNYNTPGEIYLWGANAGTGNVLVLYGSNATAGTTLQDSPTLEMPAFYWDGAAPIGWSYKVINDMLTAGATPKSRVVHSLNNVNILSLENNNGTVSILGYGNMAFQQASTISTTAGNLTISPTSYAYFTTRVGLATASPGARLDISDSWYDGVPTILIGADLSATTRTNNTSKFGFIGGFPYANANRPVLLMGYLTSDVSSTLLYGGGTGYLNAPMKHVWYTAANTNTAAGTARMTLVDAGLGIGIDPPTALLHIKAGTATANTAPFKLTTGTVLATPEAGAVEYTTPRLYYTDGIPIRQTLIPDAYSQLYEDGAGSTITVASAGTYYQWVTSTAGDFHLNTLSIANDNITIDSGGDGEYRVSYSVSYSTSANDTVHWAIFYTPSGGAATALMNISSETKIINVNEITNSSSVGLKTLAVGDKLDLRVTSTTNGTTVNVNHASLTIERVAR